MAKKQLVATDMNSNKITNLANGSSAQDAAAFGQIPVGGTPALVFGTANTAGAAATFIRTNDTILAFDATALTAEAIASASSVGTATTAARRDHIHPMPTALAVLAGVGGGYAACATAIGTAAKTVALTGYSLVVGGTVGVTFTNGNSAAAPTLNINSAGAKPIFNNGAAALTIPAGFTCLMMYDGTNYNIIDDGVGTATPATQAFGDTAVAGTSLEMAHVDHKHAMMASPKDTTAVTGILSGNGTTISAAANSAALAAVTNTNTGDQTLPTKITGATLDTLTDDTGFLTAKAIQDNTKVPHVAPGTSGNVMQSDGTNWASQTGGAGTGISNANLNTTVGELGGAWKASTPTPTGFSGTPTVSSYYSIIGKTVTWNIYVTGTSNASGFTIPAPINGVVAHTPELTTRVTNNGTIAIGVAYLSATGTLTVAADINGNGFVASGTKTLKLCVFVYEAA